MGLYQSVIDNVNGWCHEIIYNNDSIPSHVFHVASGWQVTDCEWSEPSPSIRVVHLLHSSCN